MLCPRKPAGTQAAAFSPQLLASLGLLPCDENSDPLQGGWQWEEGQLLFGK